jgi:hypothetical protein
VGEKYEKGANRLELWGFLYSAAVNYDLELLIRFFKREIFYRKLRNRGRFFYFLTKGTLSPK